MNRELILADFQACTGITDLDCCISLLESSDWDFTAALTAAVKNGVSDMDVEQFLPISSTCQDGKSDANNDVMLHTGGQACSTSRPLSQTSAHDSESVIPGMTLLEKDAGPVGACGHVRILSFEVNLELPPDCGLSDRSSLECFTYPETETVGSLKRHFIQLRLTELTLLATSPEYDQIIKKVNQNTLFAHLHFESTETYSFSDNSATLRSLHLPTFNRIDAKLIALSPSESQTNGEQTPQMRTTSDHIEICLHVSRSGFYDEGGSNTTHTHCLRLLPTWHTNQLRYDVHSLTDIPVTRQVWSERPSRGDADNKISSCTSSPISRLVSELNETPQSGTDSSSHNHTLSELGLKTGNFYTLYVADKDRMSSINHESSTTSDLVEHPMQRPVGSVTTKFKGNTINARRTSARKTNHSKPLDEHSSDIDDYFDEYDYDNDMDDFDVDHSKRNLWADPLIPESLCAGDPNEAIERFFELFLQRYCSNATAVAPPFATCSLDVALTIANANSVLDRKPLFIYLHHNDSVACHVFCQHVLCNPGFGQFLQDHNFDLWPWDVTVPRAKERLSGWLEYKIPKLAAAIAHLVVDSYPVLAMVGKVSGQLEVLCLVLGTGAVKNPITMLMDEVSFPSLSAATSDKTSTVNPASATGSLKPDVIVAELWQAYTNYMELLAPEREAELQRQARQRVREEQEEAYRESLRQDQLKAREKAKAEEQDRLEKERLERERDQETEHRQIMAARLPREPPEPNSLAAKAYLARPEGAMGIASLRFRLPRLSTTREHTSQSALLRRFAGLDKLQTVFDYVESQGFPVSKYKLLTTFPRRDLTTLDRNSTLAELKLVPQETLTLEER